MIHVDPAIGLEPHTHQTAAQARYCQEGEQGRYDDAVARFGERAVADRIAQCWHEDGLEDDFPAVDWASQLASAQATGIWLADFASGHWAKVA